MKKKLMPTLLAGIIVALSSCGNDDPAPAAEGNDDAANLDYSAANAASWGNYMTQVSGLLKKDASDLYDAWTVSYDGGQPFATSFKTHNGGDYSSALSCVNQIIEGCADIANEVGTAKIGDPYNLYVSGQTQKALYAVESWYSWHSRDDYTNNIYSIRNAYYGSLDGSTVNTNSISALMAVVNPALDTEVKSAINAAAAAIQAIPQPFRNNINSAEARQAMSACGDLEEVLTNKLAPAVAALGNDSRLQGIVDNFVDNVVLPTYSELKDKNVALHNAVAAFQAAPSNNAFRTACNAWLVAREPWEKSEAFLFGPVDGLGLDPNMDSWPLDQDAIVNILMSGNFDDLNWIDGDDDDRIESVQSVRGFHTLEFLLFKDGQPRTIE